MLKVIGHQTLYRESRFHAAFPALARFSDGSLVVAFRRARDALWLLPKPRREGLNLFARMDHIDSRSHIVLMALDAQGNPTDAPLDLLPFNPEASDQDPSLLVLPDDSLFVASFSYYPLSAEIGELLGGRVENPEILGGCRYLPWGSHASLRGREVGDWRFHHQFVQPGGGYGGYRGVEDSQPVVGAVRGQPVWSRGEILLPLYWGMREGAALFASDDAGVTWQFRGRIAVDRDATVTFQEPALCATREGGLVCFLRTADADGRLATTVSSDGVTWSEPRLHDVIGHPFHPLLLDDGRVLLSYGYREEPYGVRVRVLASPLDDPGDAPELVVRSDGLCRDIGYPWGVQLSDGRVLLAYYWTDAIGMRGIEATWLEV